MQPALAGRGGPAANWPRLPPSIERTAFSADSDPNGYFWGHGGHWPLFVALGESRDRTTESVLDRAVRERKKALFKRTKNWPWWIRHPTERFCHVGRDWAVVGNEGRGQGYTGVLWRLHRARSAPEDIRAQDALWVRLYGQESLDLALRWTRPFYERALREGLTPAAIWADPTCWVWRNDPDFPHPDPPDVPLRA